MEKQSFLQHFPVTLFAMIMGLGGLTLSWHRSHQVLQMPEWISQLLLLISVSLFLVISALYLTKLLRFPEAVKAEISHPIKISFFPTFSISLILLSTAFLPVSMALSKVVWMLGASLHLLFSLYVITQWMHQTNFTIQHSTPAWFIPVVGNILVPIAGVQHGFVEASWFFFSIGIVYWIVLKVLIFNRIIFHDPIPQKLLPTLFILIAPPAVGFIAYMQLQGGVLDGFARILYFSALFLVLLLLVQVRYFTKIPFFLSWWAYSFPLAAFSIATQIMLEKQGGWFFLVLSYVSLGFVTLLIGLLLLRTLQGVISGKLFQPEG